jgi:hypothetical protein
MTPVLVPARVWRDEHGPEVVRKTRLVAQEDTANKSLGLVENWLPERDTKEIRASQPTGDTDEKTGFQ